MPGNDFSIVLSKLDVPIPPSDTLRRPLLLRAMAHSCAGKLTCLVAERGYGKHTTLAQLTQIIGSESALLELTGDNAIPPMTVSWLHVDERDNQPMHFWGHVLALLPGAPTYNPAEDAHSQLFPAINKHFEQHHLIIFGRLDKITNTEILCGLMRLIADAPQTLHFVFSLQAMPESIKSRVYNLCPRWFTRRELQYSRAETEEQLRIMLGDTFSLLSAKNIDDIYWLTEGWANGVFLAAQAAQSAFLTRTPFSFDGSSPEVDLYFSSRVKSTLTPNIHSALSFLSLAERFNDKLLEMVFPEEETGLLTFLVNSDEILLVPCEQDTSWKRFNRLFAAWLQQEALKQPEPQLRAYCAKIGAWFFAEEATNEATKLLLIAQDYSYLEGMAYSLTGLKRTGNQSFIIWLASIDSSSFDDSPLMCILAAWAHNSAGHVKEAQHWTERFVAACKAGGEAYAQVPIEFAQRFMTIKCNTMIEGGDETYQECEDIIASNDHIEPSLLSTLYQTLGESKMQSGQLADAEDLFLQAQACASVDGTSHQLYFNMYFIAEMHYRLGHLDDVERTCKQLLANKKVPLVFRSATQALLSISYTERMNFALAEPLVKEACLGSSVFQNLDLFLNVEISNASLLLATGHASEAYVQISEAIMRVEHYIVPRQIIIDAYYCQACIAATRHNIRDLKIILKKCRMLLHEQDAIHKAEVLHIQAMLHKAEGALAEALDALDAAYAFAAEHGFRLIKTRIMMHKVSCLYQNGCADEARENLYRAIQEASTYGYPGSLIGHDKSIENALINYSSSLQASPAIREFVKNALSHSTNGQVQAAVSGIHETSSSGIATLSEREREVISLLKLGMSRQEISDSLCVSINTTKKHLASIYAKLGVTSKTELLDLLPPNF